MKRPCHLMATFAKAKRHRRNGATPFINSANALATRPGTAVEDIDSICKLKLYKTKFSSSISPSCV